MSTYLVQSGTVRRAVEADDARKAALWVAHLAMAPALDPLGGPPEIEGRLGRRIRVLRADGLETGSWPVHEILVEWHQLLVALERIERCFAEEDLPADTADQADGVAERRELALAAA